MTATPTPREIRRLRNQQRQTVIFASLLAVMGVLALIGAVIAVGILPIPFGNNFNEREVMAIPGSHPCPFENSVPAPTNTIVVNVLNSTSRDGLASEVADDLKAQSIRIRQVGNASTQPFAGTVKIVTGAKALTQAYTLAGYFDGSELVLGTRDDGVIDLVVGEDYDGMLPAAEIQALPKDTAFPKPKHCATVSPPAAG